MRWPASGQGDPGARGVCGSTSGCAASPAAAKAPPWYGGTPLHFEAATSAGFVTGTTQRMPHKARTSSRKVEECKPQPGPWQARPLVSHVSSTWLFTRSVHTRRILLPGPATRSHPSSNVAVCSHCTSVPVDTRRIKTKGPSGRPWGLAASTYDDRLAALAGPALSLPDRSLVVQLRRR